MTDAVVRQLPGETVKLITSSQIVTSVSTTVKELFENALDAGAKIIQVRLENYGLDLIEIKDNGSGVSYENVQRMFLPGYTSKIKQFEDLDSLTSYGFRGEALAAICKVAKVTITTKTNSDTLAMTYEIDSTGLPLSSKPSHLNNGTIVTVTSLFSTLPVRRLHLSGKKKQADELKKTEHTIQSLSLIHPDLNVSLIHNKCIVWKKSCVKCLKQSFMQVVTLKTVTKMHHINKLINQISIDLIVPKKDLDTVDEVFSNSVNCMYVYVNKRPIVCKALSKPVQEHVFHHYRNLNTSFKYAVSFVSISVPPQQVDVNLEPNKTKVLLKNELDVIKIIDETLMSYYSNVNFHCSALKEAIIEDEYVEEIENMSAVTDEESILEEEHQLKRPRLEVKQQNKNPPRSIDKFIQRNWHVEIVNTDNIGPDVGSSTIENESAAEPISNPQNLCSQINKDNCVLTTHDEVTELNSLLNEQNFQSVVSMNNKNSQMRLVERNDLQGQPIEKKTLPEWPIRSVPDTPTTPPSATQSNEIVPETPDSQTLDDIKSKTIQEIAAEIESDVEKWSTELSKVMKEEGKEIKEPGGVDEDQISRFDLSMESISSQMGKKEMKAFTKFARIMRPRILSEFPKLMFPQVASILAERWKALTPTEVKYYENMAAVVDSTRRSYKEDKESSKVSETPRKSTEKNLRSIFEQIKRRNKLSRPPRREVTLVTTLNQIKKSVENSANGANVDNDDGAHRIVGQLQPSRNWLYVRGKEIGHIRHGGLTEVITYQKMLSSHVVDRKPLDRPIQVTPSNLGDHLWQVLTSLGRTELNGRSSRRSVVDNDLITKNGFQVECEMEGDATTACHITHVAAEIPQFGIADLKDALTLYAKNGEAGGLANWRPTSVRNYLTNEAIRRSQTNLTDPDLAEMEGILDTYNLCLRHLPPVCLHSRDFFVPIHHIQ